MRVRTVRIQGHDLVEGFDAAHRSDHATRFVGAHLRVAPGARAAEIGCGTGVLSLLMARLGAREVWATDVDPAAVALAAEGARRNGFSQVRTVVGNLLDEVPAEPPLDVVAAVMPQKPSPVRFSVAYSGGEDGADLL